MARVAPLASDKLRVVLDPARVPWRDSSQARVSRNTLLFHERAASALELALGIHVPGYNIYLSGESGCGRTWNLLSWMLPRTKKAPTPPDQVYVYNFARTDEPLLILLPAGSGRRLSNGMRTTLKRLKADLGTRLGSIPYSSLHDELLVKFNARKLELLQKIQKEASILGLNIDTDESGQLSLVPAHGNTSCEPGKLSGALLSEMRELEKVDEALREEEEHLASEVWRQCIRDIFDPFVNATLRRCQNEALEEYLSQLRAELLKKNGRSQSGDSFDSQDPKFSLNVLVDNSMQKGAPVVEEHSPGMATLLGMIERDSEINSMVADPGLLRAGSLQRAHGGYLVLHAEEVLRKPNVWDSLLKSLVSQEVRIGEGTDISDTTTPVRVLKPQPLKLRTTIILIGSEELYEQLLLEDERFAKLFRIKAHMASEVERTPQNLRAYLNQLALVANEASLLPFSADAVAELADWSSRICEDQKKLSLRFSDLRDVMVEASSLANGKAPVDKSLVIRALAERARRNDLVEEMILQDYASNSIRVSTFGTAVGEVNGLALSWCSGYEFGLPHRISCTVGVGHDGIIDLERESDLGGPVHTKAVMILKSFLVNLFARKRPLVLSASVYFQQSYAEVEGDSASAAELMSLLSALAETPLRLDLAFTGAVGHTGEIMAVGGVTKKIEGFYKVCRLNGLTGTQGVLIPSDNVRNLMLDEDIVSSVEKGEFAIYPVRTIEQAILLLTGLPAGKRRKNGTFTPGSLYAKVDRRLENLGAYAQNSFRKPKE